MISINNFVDKVFCINLKKRIHKKIYMQTIAKQYKLKINFFNAIEDKNGWIGCLKSHLEIIKIAKKQKLKKILILEDDCLIKSDDLIINKKLIPKKWDMLYLGANVINILEKNQMKCLNKSWVKFSGLCTHAYIINNKIYNDLIKLLTPCKKPVDVYYSEYHVNHNCYIKNPEMIIQAPSYSDIENKKVTYNLRSVKDVIEIPLVKTIEEGNHYKLDIDDIPYEKLPNVSILTITKNRKHLFELPIYCFNNFIYPKEKLEWVIIDDSDDGTNLKDILPNDKRIRYVKINTNKKIKLDMKRNISVKYASHDYLAIMDDDDYYFPISIISRISVLLNYPKINCVGCSVSNIYNVNQDKIHLVGSNNLLGEGSLAFTKKFWKKKKFKILNRKNAGEGLSFYLDRKNECLEIPSNFVFIIINHKSNITGSLRTNIKEDEIIYNNEFIFPDPVMKIIKKIHN